MGMEINKEKGKSMTCGGSEDVDNYIALTWKRKEEEMKKKK